MSSYENLLDQINEDLVILSQFIDYNMKRFQDPYEIARMVVGYEIDAVKRGIAMGQLASPTEAVEMIENIKAAMIELNFTIQIPTKEN